MRLPRGSTAVAAAFAVLLGAAWMLLGTASAGAPTAVPAAAASAAASCATPRAGDLWFKVDAGSGPRQVILHVPPGGRPGARPLVLGLGGAGQTGSAFEHITGYSRLADREGFLVAYPTATGARPFWNISGRMAGKPDDVAFLSKVLDRVEDLACVDRSRVYATGVSNGGGMTALLGCSLAWRLAAIAPVAGGYSVQPPCRPERALPVLEVHGDADEVVPYNGKGPAHAGSVPAFLGTWRRINACRGKARLLPSPPGVTELTWSPCASGADVVHDVIAGEPHSWPAWTRTRSTSKLYSTTYRTWAFFRGHAQPPGNAPGAPVTASGGTQAHGSAAQPDG